MAHLHLAIEPENVKTGPAPIPFPIVRASQAAATSATSATAADAPHEALLALDAASRRMEDLARELGCLGYFDERDDEPTAA